MEAEITKSTPEILREARDLISKEDSWASGWFAFAADGTRVKSLASDEACKYCATGAVLKICGVNDVWESWGGDAWDESYFNYPKKKAIRLLYESLLFVAPRSCFKDLIGKKIFLGQSSVHGMINNIAYIQDHFNMRHEHIMNAFDVAICSETKRAL